MKKIVLFASFVIATSIMVSSCGKSTKGKMENSWTIALEQTTSEGGGVIQESKLSGLDLTLTTTSGGVPTSSTGIISVATMNILKDGTWEREISATFTEGSGPTEIITIISEKQSGTWDFLGGVGDFKKNERVIFNTLSETLSQTVTPDGGAATVTVTTDKYLEGESIRVFTITESKAKSLKMQQNFNNTSTVSGSTSVSTESTFIELTAPKGK